MSAKKVKDYMVMFTADSSQVEKAIGKLNSMFKILAAEVMKSMSAIDPKIKASMDKAVAETIKAEAKIGAEKEKSTRMQLEMDAKAELQRERLRDKREADEKKANDKRLADEKKAIEKSEALKKKQEERDKKRIKVVSDEEKKAREKALQAQKEFFEIKRKYTEIATEEAETDGVKQTMLTKKRLAMEADMIEAGAKQQIAQLELRLQKVKGNTAQELKIYQKMEDLKSKSAINAAKRRDDAEEIHLKRARQSSELGENISAIAGGGLQNANFAGLGASLGDMFGGPFGAAVGTAVGGALTLLMKTGIADLFLPATAQVAKLNEEAGKLQGTINAVAVATASINLAIELGDVESFKKAMEDTKSVIETLPEELEASKAALMQMTNIPGGLTNEGLKDMQERLKIIKGESETALIANQWAQADKSAEVFGQRLAEINDKYKNVEDSTAMQAAMREEINAEIAASTDLQLRAAEQQAEWEGKTFDATAERARIVAELGAQYNFVNAQMEASILTANNLEEVEISIADIVDSSVKGYSQVSLEQAKIETAGREIESTMKRQDEILSDMVADAQQYADAQTDGTQREIAALKVKKANMEAVKRAIDAQIVALKAFIAGQKASNLNAQQARKLAEDLAAQERIIADIKKAQASGVAYTGATVAAKSAGTIDSSKAEADLANLEKASATLEKGIAAIGKDISSLETTGKKWSESAAKGAGSAKKSAENADKIMETQEKELESREKMAKALQDRQKADFDAFRKRLDDQKRTNEEAKKVAEDHLKAVQAQAKALDAITKDMGSKITGAIDQNAQKIEDASKVWLDAFSAAIVEREKKLEARNVAVKSTQKTMADLKDDEIQAAAAKKNLRIQAEAAEKSKTMWEEFKKGAEIFKKTMEVNISNLQRNIQEVKDNKDMKAGQKAIVLSGLTDQLSQMQSNLIKTSADVDIEKDVEVIEKLYKDSVKLADIFTTSSGFSFGPEAFLAFFNQKIDDTKAALTETDKKFDEAGDKLEQAQLAVRMAEFGKEADALKQAQESLSDILDTANFWKPYLENLKALEKAAMEAKTGVDAEKATKAYTDAYSKVMEEAARQGVDLGALDENLSKAAESVQKEADNLESKRKTFSKEQQALLDDIKEDADRAADAVLGVKDAATGARDAMTGSLAGVEAATSATEDSTKALEANTKALKDNENATELQAQKDKLLTEGKKLLKDATTILGQWREKQADILPEERAILDLQDQMVAQQNKLAAAYADGAINFEEFVKLQKEGKEYTDSMMETLESDKFSANIKNASANFSSIVEGIEGAGDAINGLAIAIGSGNKSQIIDAGIDTTKKVGQALLNAPLPPLQLAGAVILGVGMVAGMVKKIIDAISNVGMSMQENIQLHATIEDSINELYESRISLMEKMKELRRADMIMVREQAEYEKEAYEEYRKLVQQSQEDMLAYEKDKVDAAKKLFDMQKAMGAQGAALDNAQKQYDLTVAQYELLQEVIVTMDEMADMSDSELVKEEQKLSFKKSQLEIQLAELEAAKESNREDRKAVLDKYGIDYSGSTKDEVSDEIDSLTAILQGIDGSLEGINAELDERIRKQKILNDLVKEEFDYQDYLVKMGKSELEALKVKQATVTAALDQELSTMRSGIRYGDAGYEGYGQAERDTISYIQGALAEGDIEKAKKKILELPPALQKMLQGLTTEWVDVENALASISEQTERLEKETDLYAKKMKLNDEKLRSGEKTEEEHDEKALKMMENQLKLIEESRDAYESKLDWMIAIEEQEAAIYELQKKMNGETDKGNKKLVEQIRLYQEAWRDFKKTGSGDSKASMDAARQKIREELEKQGKTEEQINAFLATLPQYSGGGPTGPGADAGGATPNTGGGFPAILHPKEWVVTEAGRKHAGDVFLEALNRQNATPEQILGRFQNDQQAAILNFNTQVSQINNFMMNTPADGRRAGIEAANFILDTVQKGLDSSRLRVPKK